ncbi:helix-turn-helix transcriptional regulator [Vibrio sp. JPW-9-11-11]|uniref:AraC family transcriptional regulator n=1 Tax=Vibrio sp. JPW-9-11-11 TaxID=1416532 RepID=UPI00159426DB|nr:AraC family transcriptional regulator [Vibrio sp. JPW-9-11-11]NVD08739.1 helix-turn-helix transcriptional regulator [Vibrio sp. JPW-9-11-11]
MKPFIENVLNTPHYDWLVREYYCRHPKQTFTCPWHYHAEYELVLYLDDDEVFNGHYLAGDAIGPVSKNTVLLYGPGLPHLIKGTVNASEERVHHSIVVWFKQHWVDKLQAAIPEARHLKRLLEQAAYGVKFSRSTADHVAQLLSQIEQLDRHHQAIRLMEALIHLSDDLEYSKISSTPYRLNQLSDDKDAHRRVEQASRYIESHYHQSIKIADLCQALHLSESSAYRLFEKHYGVSFSDHLKQYRIGKACELLVNTQIPVSLVAEKSGFQNLSNFNRQFKTVKQMTPSQFRRQFELASH